MIRVLHVVTDSNIGGAGHQLLDLIDASDRAAFDMEVVLPENAALIPLLTARGITFTTVPHIADCSFSWKAVHTLCALFRQKRPMIVHTHAALSGRVAARLYGRGCKIVHTRHSVFPQEPSAGLLKLARKVKRLATGLVNNTLSDAMIAVSPAARDDLLQLGADHKKIHVIYNGTRPVRAAAPVEKAALRQKYGVPDGSFVMVQIARLTEVKGHDYVLDAVKQINDPDIYVLIAGDGACRARLEKRLTDEHITQVRLLGFVAAVDEIENIMDVQINASYGTEATSLALLQGMSLGVPAVASDYGGNPYVIAHEVNGLMVPERNASALRDALLRLKNDPVLYQRLSDGAKQRYAEMFTAGEMARKTERLYRSLV